MMTRDLFVEIMHGDNDGDDKSINEVFDGLQIVVKYLPHRCIECAAHDQIWSANIDDLAEAGITEAEVKKLHDMNWFLDGDELCHFV